MEIIALVALILLFLLSLTILDRLKTQDNREPYVRNEDGLVLALRVAGPEGDVPSHESVIHDGTPHQNPAVRTYTVAEWFLFFPYWVTIEERYYPITDNGVNQVNTNVLQRRIDNLRLRKHQEVELVEMPDWAEGQAIRRENGQQLGRGVEAYKLARRGR